MFFAPGRSTTGRVPPTTWISPALSMVVPPLPPTPPTWHGPIVLRGWVPGCVTNAAMTALSGSVDVLLTTTTKPSRLASATPTDSNNIAQMGLMLLVRSDGGQAPRPGAHPTSIGA